MSAPASSEIHPFEDHCWQDVVPADVMSLYAPYRREVGIGPRPALLLIDLYRLAYAGGDRPIAEIAAEHPSSCGEVAWRAVPPTRSLIEAARRAGLPVLYTTGRPRTLGAGSSLDATRRRGSPPAEADFAIMPDFAPREGDVVIAKERASAFFGTLLTAHLTRLGVQSLIVAGESTSGCVRASAVDAYSHGYHVSLVEECCFDRFDVAHKLSLFDLHHKYADVLKLREVMSALETMAGARR